MPRLLRLLPLPLLVLPLLWVGWTLFNGVREHPDSFAGLPRAQDMALLPWSPRSFQVIDPPGFVLGYAEYWRNPLWVAYRLEQRVAGPYGRRPEQFRIDARTFSRVTSGDYTGSGFDRGHMAPNYAMSRFHGRAAQQASFRMSNVVPQQGRLNQKLWQRLEEIEADVYAAGASPLWVVMGPLFEGEDQRLSSGVAIPTRSSASGRATTPMVSLRCWHLWFRKRSTATSRWMTLRSRWMRSRRSPGWISSIAWMSQWSRAWSPV